MNAGKMHQLDTAGLKDLAVKLQTDYPRAIRPGRPEPILTDNLFDMEKIYDLYDRTGTEYERFLIVNLMDVVEDAGELAPDLRFTRDTPVGAGDHYMFKQTNRAVPAVRAFRVKNVYLSFDVRMNSTPEFYTFTRDKALIRGLSHGGLPFLEAPAYEVKGRSVFADDYHSVFNICHLTFDKFPRAWLARERWGIDTGLLLNGNAYTEALGELTDLRLQALSQPSFRRGTVFLEDCVFFSNSYFAMGHPNHQGSPEHAAALKDLRTAAVAKCGQFAGPDRYFQLRAQANSRAIENIDQIRPILDRHGFTLGDPGTLSPGEQFGLFTGVSLLAGVHGAGLTHLLFQPEGSTLLELLPPLCASSAYWDSAMALGLNYQALVCHDPERGDCAASQKGHDSRFNRQNVIVPPDELEERLSTLCNIPAATPFGKEGVMTLDEKLKELHRGYLPYRNDTVPFPVESVVVWYYAYALQATEAITGDILEMGVEHGGTAFLAASAIAPGEKLVLVDSRKSEKFTRMLATMPEARQQQIDFRECPTAASSLNDIERRKFRFIHIDAGHTRENVLYDFNRFAKCLAEDGLLCFDNVFEVRWPGVTEAVIESVPGSGLEPVLFANRKLYLAHAAAAPRYREIIESNLDALSEFGTPRVWTEPFLGAPTVLMKMGINSSITRDIEAARANAAKLHAEQALI